MTVLTLSVDSHRFIKPVSCTLSLIHSFLPSPIMSSPPKNNSQGFVKHSRPIPIGTAHSRHRSASTCSSDSSGSPTSPSAPQTPLNNTTPPRMIPNNISPSSSPILSYFMAQSPTKTATFPFNRNFPGRPPVFEGLCSPCPPHFHMAWADCIQKMKLTQKCLLLRMPGGQAPPPLGVLPSSSSCQSCLILSIPEALACLGGFLLAMRLRR